MYRMYRGYGNVPTEHFLRTCSSLEEAKGLTSLYEDQDFLVVIRNEMSTVVYQTAITEPPGKPDRLELEPELPELIIDNDIRSEPEFTHFCNACGTALTGDGADSSGTEHECHAEETEGVEFTT